MANSSVVEPCLRLWTNIEETIFPGRQLVEHAVADVWCGVCSGLPNFHTALSERYYILPEDFEASQPCSQPVKRSLLLMGPLGIGWR